jgi:hypothetical protein
MNFFELDDRPDKTGSWFDQDSRELFKKNLKTQSTDWRYRNIKVTYRLNSMGYRTQEFNSIPWHKSIVIFGCSYVFGIGCELSGTIAAKLAELTNLPVINMGAPGSSPMFSLHNSAILSAIYSKPLAVVFSWSSSQRCPLYLNNSVVHCGQWNEDISGLGKAWRRFDSHNEMQLKMTRLTAQQMWSNTKYYDFTLYPSNRKTIDCDFIKQVDVSRDLVHSGIVTNELIAKKIAQSLNL